MEDLEKRKQVYGICGECNEPGTGEKWCQPCNAKRFKDNFKNWTSGNKNIDEFIQHSQLNALCYGKCLEWIPYEKFQNITYIAKGGFGKVYLAEWPEGHTDYWDIENQKWRRCDEDKYALKSLNNSSGISSDFFNEIKSHLQIHLLDIITCYGITQDPNTKEYMMVLEYCKDGNLRNYLNKSEEYIGYRTKLSKLQRIARGLSDIHIAGKVHKDFHSGNILFSDYIPYICDLGMSRPANKQAVKREGICGVLPYMAPEVIRGHQYTQAADIYSFGIIMNELLSEEIPYNDIPHDEFLAIKICKGQRPEISKDAPKLLADLITRCWDAKIENRPTAKELYQTLLKWFRDSKNSENNQNIEIFLQIKECDEIREKKFNNRSNEDRSKNIQTHPQAIYTSRHLNFKNLPEPVNSSTFQFNSDANYDIQSTAANPISACLDVQLSELELNEICQDCENNIE
ncbi:kinase-like domain-containing protein [Rhizophagus irregularis DAOM 181602=DAOM 197198]|uniref:Kinase-like domain-containing protein n=2 Tax=Rhizophagus irregularis TaxID=588596 RepID=A0A2P4PM50_RHIID|nr:kinase-like domain-containing protein [Rhizophagus irregularis DAOM 181602=DAOM 197198]POG66450.1 kinase-like domain-containing protein [Rhizophagus irregularis DAOM 181602=DAOM 197198]|eukprot:XP_025173316.1 kinase-like domain-containing protein [Rhizophagus irregularis DAOM 181602=DAOM 197198]